jgi:excinuclease ABC subunit A
VACCDWVIDIGPDGGEKGGEIVVVGTPEDVAAHLSSHTGAYLREILGAAATGAKVPERASAKTPRRARAARV